MVGCVSGIIVTGSKDFKNKAAGDGMLRTAFLWDIKESQGWRQVSTDCTQKLSPRSGVLEAGVSGASRGSGEYGLEIPRDLDQVLPQPPSSFHNLDLREVCRCLANGIALFIIITFDCFSNMLNSAHNKCLLTISCLGGM